MAIDQGKSRIEPWYDQLIEFPKDRPVTPEERSRTLRKVIQAMIGITDGIESGTIVHAEIRLKFASEIGEENTAFSYIWVAEEENS